MAVTWRSLRKPVVARRELRKQQLLLLPHPRPRQRSQTTSPQTTTPPTTTPTPTTPGQTTAPGAQGTKLPEVQVIQEQPKPKPKPVKQAVKPKKTPTPVAAQAASPPPAEAAAAPEGPSYAQPIESDMVKMSPIGGSEIPIGKVPTAVGRASAADIQRTGDVTVQNVLQSRVPGVHRK